jgi:hypothetical protein
MDNQRLNGRWRRVSERGPVADPETVPFGHDASLLPGEIEFDGARYRASRAEGQPFIVWDVGTFELDADQLRITLANDAWATYDVELGDDTLVVADALGNRTVYQRMR